MNLPRNEMKKSVDTDPPIAHSSSVSGKQPPANLNRKQNMIITSEFTYQKKDLPAGKLDARWIYSRGVYQVYLSGRCLYGVAGETEEECLTQLNLIYDYDKSRIINFN